MGSALTFRNRLMLAGACALVAMAGAPASMAADSTAAAPASVNLAIGQASAVQSESVVVKARRRLLKEANSPSAVTELGQKQIAATGVQGSVATLLRAAPSVYVYQQGIGENSPVLSIRGVRGLEVAQTLDGVPMQDLLNGGTGEYLVNNLGARYTLNQISGVSIYPGVAFPDKATFGTIGGTVAYTTKRPTNDYYLDVDGSVGSFGTYQEGFELNSGAIDSFLGTGDNAAKVLLNYHNLQTNGFIDYTSARYNDMEFAFDKPYDDGLSNFQATVTYNTGGGYLQGEPVPVPYQQRYGFFSNYSPDQEFQRQYNDYTTVILKDDTYVNDYLSVGLTAFYLNSDSEFSVYENPSLILSQSAAGLPLPFVQSPNNFFPQDYFLPGGPFAIPGHFSYNPSIFNNSTGCPANQVVAITGANPCGINASVADQHNDSYGIQPRVTIIAPEIAGIANTIKIGGLIAKETQPTPQTYIYGTADVPKINGYNSVAPASDFYQGGFDGGAQRTIYQGYVQDKIDALDNTLHLTPGATLEGTKSSNHADDGFLSNGTIGDYKLTKWDREFLPFFNISYDLNGIFPALAGLSAYGSIGNSALFAPATDFVPNLAGGAPYASIVHMYEGGLQYNTQSLFLRADYFYQKVDRDFGFFAGQGSQTGFTVYSNDGEREFKGFEATGTWQVTPQWQLFGNVSHTLAKYLQTALEFATVFDDQYGAGIKGTPISGIPDWLANFGVEYDNKNLFIDNDSFSARLGGTYTGQQYTTCDIYNGANETGPLANLAQYDGKCSDAPAGSPSVPNSLKTQTGGNYGGLTVTDTNHRLSAFAVFNLLLSYTMPTPELPMVKHVKFDLNIQNLFDQRYYQYFYSQITPVAGAYVGNSFNNGLPGEPFAVTFTATARF